MAKIAVIRVRGVQGLRRDAVTAFIQLGLRRKHSCVLIDAKDAGMLKSVKDYATWGEASEETVKAIGTGVKHLHPPRGGWGGSIKQPYPQGALGKRGDVNELVKRMAV